jgi:tetratricopeptide (TPR) repeat protein/peroxiredoxin
LIKKSKARQPANLGRRDFLSRSCAWASASLLASPLRNFGFALPFRAQHLPPPQTLDDRLIPHYRQPAPIDAVLRLVEPGLDDFITEKYAERIKTELEKWSGELTQSPAKFGAVENSLAQNLRAVSLIPSQRQPLRTLAGLEVFRNQFPNDMHLGPPQFIDEFRKFVGTFSNVLTAEFKVARISLTGNPDQPAGIQTRIRYDLVGSGAKFYRGERVGHWDLEWESDSAGAWRVSKWQAVEETESRASGPMFVDVTARAFGLTHSYQQQLIHGADHWRTILDGASRIDVYGNNGIAVGDMDGDGFDDVYVCQPSGLPNRLYRNRGNGTFEDVTERAGVDVLDSTACALFADVRNSGHQDLIVVCVDGPLLFLNDGSGKFQLKPDAFKFAQTPQGTFTGAALADYDGDGFLDIYFGLYSYYLGINQYQYPTPYYDAQNGPPNFLMHNLGDGTFADVTAASGMNVNNNRYTFTCGWVDFDRDGRPDLYVVNDFGRKNLFRNNGDGTFADVAREAGVEDVGAGMSVCWFDYDNDGKQDLYVADMWSAAGGRVSTQKNFMKSAPEDVRALLRKHAEGNSLFRNEGAGRFTDQSAHARVQMGRWSWSSYAWDFDHDGYGDLYIANGMISGPDQRELSSFFWRQTVAETPVRLNPAERPVPSPKYELGWNAINELIRSDGTWAGYERNNFYANNRDGTFSEIAGTIGLDFIEDSRTFALADFDHDGRLEVFLKNRSGPQLRVLHNEMDDLGESIAFRLRGHKSNRDAIGAEVTLEAGELRQVKFIQAGAGFLSQHTKDLHFGLGKTKDAMRATVRWPSGLIQRFENLAPGNIILIDEGSAEFNSVQFSPFVTTVCHPGPGGLIAIPGSAPGCGSLGIVRKEPLKPVLAEGETWLLAPVAAPDFALQDIAGHERKLADFRGHPLLLNFWRTSSPESVQDLPLFEQRHARWAARGLGMVSINLNPAEDANEIRRLATGKHYSFPILLATEETAAVYNILYHYLFDRRRNLGIPTSFLVDAMGRIVKVYQGPVKPTSIEADFLHIPQTAAERGQKGLPFPGRLYGGEFRRNQFTYALVFMERGYADQALSSCQLVLEHEPENAEAHYLMGMIYLKKKMNGEARASFERTVHTPPSQPSTWPDAWNNLGMLAAQEGRSEEAIANLKEAIRLNPGYTVALENLGNVYRQQHRWADAQAMLERALETDPNDADVNYGLAMNFAQQGDTQNAEKYFDAAIRLRPDYPEALNNLGVLYLNTRRVDEGVKSFETCVRVAPDFDQAYINLAKVYAQRGERDRAADILRQVLQRHPDQALAKRMLEELAR